MADIDFDGAFDEAASDAPYVPKPAPAPEPAAPAATLSTDTGVQQPAPAKVPEPSPAPKDPEPAKDPAEPEDPDAPVEPAKPVEPVEPQSSFPQAARNELDPRYLAQAIAEAQAEQTRQAKALAQQAEPAKPKTSADYLTAEQTKAIDKFKEEWPDEFNAVTQMLGSQMRAEMDNYRAALTAQFQQDLAPLYQKMGTAEVSSHRNALLIAHPDIDSLDMGKIQGWIGSQPSLLRPALQQTFEAGSTGDVIELLNMYKSSTGSASAAPAPPASQSGTKPAAQPAPAARQPVDESAKRALAAVPAAQRQRPAAKASEEDFDAAFAEAVGQA